MKPICWRRIIQSRVQLIDRSVDGMGVSVRATRINIYLFAFQSTQHCSQLNHVFCFCFVNSQRISLFYFYCWWLQAFHVSHQHHQWIICIINCRFYYRKSTEHPLFIALDVLFFNWIAIHKWDWFNESENRKWTKTIESCIWSIAIGILKK